MLTKRIIPCLDVKNGRVVKGIRFQDLRDAGDPAQLAELYMHEMADELVFLDISASQERRDTMLSWVRDVADRIFIPFTVGGGISSVETAREIISLGADKISLNTAAVRQPQLITDCSQLLGSQAVVVAIDAKTVAPGKWEVYIEGGKTPTGKDAIQWAMEAERLGCGEILLTSMDKDGTESGYDNDIMKTLGRSVRIPVIASGGAGTMNHILDTFKAGSDAALAASIFHFGTIRIKDLKKYLSEHNIPVRR